MRAMSRGRAIAVTVVCGVLCSAALPAAAAPRRVGEEGSVTTWRLGDADRYATSAPSARELWAQQAVAGDTLVVVNGWGDGADGLVASSLAGRLQAPLVWVAPDDVPDPVEVAIEDQREVLGRSFRDVVIIGGPSSVSEDVVATLAELTGASVRRVAGDDRTATAAAAIGDFPVIAGKRTAILVNGWNLAGAQAAAPAVYRGLPVLLTDGEALSPATADAIARHGIEHVIVAGPQSVLSEEVVDAVTALGPSVERVSGQTAQDTATALNAWAATNAGMSGDSLYVASGSSIVDALAAGPLAGLGRGAVIVTGTAGAYDLGGEQYLVSPTTAAWLQTRLRSISDVVAIGQTSRVDDLLLHAVATATDMPIIWAL